MKDRYEVAGNPAPGILQGAALPPCYFFNLFTTNIFLFWVDIFLFLMSSVVNLFVRCPEDGGVSLPKLPVSEIEVYKGGCRGDFNFFRLNKFKGDKSHRAVLIMSLDVLAKLNDEGWPVKPGDLGENLTIDERYGSLQKGNSYRAGGVVLQLMDEARPCLKLEQLSYVGTDKLRQFIETMRYRRGWYAQVLEEGKVQVGDKFSLVQR